MRKNYAKTIIFLAVFCLICPSRIVWAKDIYAFLDEELNYTVMWQGINIGTATISLTQKTDTPKPVFEITVRAKTNTFFSFFYKANDFVQSTIDPINMVPLSFEKHLKEGKRESEESTTFLHDKGIAFRKKRGKTQEIKIPTDIQDPISCLYKFRTLDFKNNVSMYINSKDKNHELKLNLVKKEKLEIHKQGVFDCFIIQPDLTYEGIFMHNGKLLIWFTDDEYKIPLKMECKLPFGKATALINFKKSIVIASCEAARQSRGSSSEIATPLRGSQ